MSGGVFPETIKHLIEKLALLALFVMRKQIAALLIAELSAPKASIDDSVDCTNFSYDGINLFNHSMPTTFTDEPESIIGDEHIWSSVFLGSLKTYEVHLGIILG